MILQSARANLGDTPSPITRSLAAACKWTEDETATTIVVKQEELAAQNDMPIPVVVQEEEEEEAIAQDPLKMELDEDDLEGRARDADAREKQDKADLAAAEAEVEATASTSISTIAERTRNESEKRTATPEPAQPTVLSSRMKTKLLHGAVGRICAVGISTTAAVRASGGDQDLWIQLITRLVTRGLDGDAGGVQAPEAGSMKAEKDAIRKQMFDFVTADIGNRCVDCLSFPESTNIQSDRF